MSEKAVASGACEIVWCGCALTLLAERAVWWEEHGTLLVADVHLGKPASFRAGGSPVPEAVTGADLGRLSALIERFGARRLVVLGDLAHDGAAWGATTLAAVRVWRGRHGGVEIVLVRGNHDVKACDPPGELGIRVVEAGWELGGVAMHHDPALIERGPALAGHVHPGVAMRRRDGRRGGMRSACFLFSERVGVLPAFGVFTGCATVRPGVGGRVFAVGADQVIEVGADHRPDREGGRLERAVVVEGALRVGEQRRDEALEIE